MTDPAAPALDAAIAQQTETAPLLVEPDADSRLAQLHAAYPEAKAAADEAAARLKTITDGIKAELTAVVPEGTDRMELRGGDGPSLRLTRVETWRFDSTRLKKEDPALYVRYAKQSASWTLKAVGGAQ